MDAQTIALLIVAVCLIYLISVFVFLLVMFIGSAVEHALRVRQARFEDYDRLAGSAFTIPVSVLLPAYNEEPVILSVVESLLENRYPNFEVIAINDGSEDRTLDVLRERYKLERREVFYRRRFKTEPVIGIYRSRVEPRLTVVDKVNGGGKADALNAGFNLARYRYVCVVDADTVYTPDALLYAMRPALSDPQLVVGVSCPFSVSGDPAAEVLVRRSPQGEGGPRESGGRRIDGHPLTNFQLLEILRAFVNNRLAWARWNFMLCSAGAFSIWRRDLVDELGGFSRSFTCEDIEFTFRVHERLRREGRPYRVVVLPESVGATEGPDTLGRLISQRARWQRVIVETVWHYRRMLFNPRYGTVGLVGVPYYLLVEVASPIFQVLGFVAIPLAWWAGVFDVVELLLLLVAVALVNGTLTSLALFLDDRATRDYRLGDLVRLMALSVLELFVYRPVMLYAHLKGLVDFLRGDKRWNKFERNGRRPPQERDVSRRAPIPVHSRLPKEYRARRAFSPIDPGKFERKARNERRVSRPS